MNLIKILIVGLIFFIPFILLLIASYIFGDFLQIFGILLIYGRLLIITFCIPSFLFILIASIRIPILKRNIAQINEEEKEFGE